ncbi:AraC family transcriptional regulator [Pseudorhodoferax sp.]|uniref:AraC family transcriptional regulator n=1 Tax=Pseudorhodoferax sp. TaxID=1993553 RepID=UPI002DD65B4E|nr:AraC family transcriptional regulator [Pseudorhodoferax sp.]
MDPTKEAVPEPVLQPPVTVSMAFVRGMLAVPLQRQLAWQDWLATVGIPPALLAQPGARVTADQYIALYRLLRERMQDEGLGLFSRPMRQGCYALVVRSLLDAPTLGHAVRRLATGYDLLLDDARFDCVPDGSRLALRLFLPPQAVAERAYVHEFMLRVFLHTLVWLSGGTLRAQRIDFACEAPPHAGEYATVFPGELRFAQAASALWFAQADLAAPVRRDAAALRDYLAKAPGHVVLPRRTDRTMTARVRDHLQRERPHWPDLPAVADALHLSVSALQRRLAAEGGSFQEVRNALRCDLAVLRLNTSAVPLAELAHELGFSDNASFQRAFKAWTGTAPGTYRSRGLA